MTLDELKRRGYRIRVGYGSWTVFFGPTGLSRKVACGKLHDVFVNKNPGHEVDLNELDKKSIKAAIGAAHADLVKRRIDGQKV